MPPGEHLAPEQRSTAERRLDLAPGAGVRPLRRVVQVARNGELLHERALDDGEPPRQARERAAEGPADESRPRLAVRRELIQPRANRPQRGTRQEAARIERHLGHDEQDRVVELLRLEHRLEMRADLL